MALNILLKVILKYCLSCFLLHFSMSTCLGILAIFSSLFNFDSFTKVCCLFSLNFKPNQILFLLAKKINGRSNHFRIVLCGSKLCISKK